MNHSLTSWLLAGALAASLAWNLRTPENPDPEPTCGSCAAMPVDCSAALDGLELSPDQRRALDAWSVRACGPNGASAERAVRELFEALAARELDPARVRALAADAGRLRAETLRDCVESVIEVRRVLTPEQAEKLIGACCAPRTE